MKEGITMNKSALCDRREALLISTTAVAGSLAATSLGRIARGADDLQAERAAAVPAKPEDVGSVDALVAALYSAISGPAGRRDLGRLRSLFRPDARLMVCLAPRKDEEKGITSLRVFTIDEFIKVIEPRVKTEGFFEREIARRAERFGSVAHVFSTYESRRRENDPEPFARGINSIQLFFDGKRWWVVTIFWDSERAGQAIPAEYLPKHPA
jgi:hypothetical protein